MGSYTDISSDEKMVHSPTETIDRMIKDPLDISDYNDGSNNEQGHLWMCVACAHQPTFETIYDLFYHKREHNTAANNNKCSEIVACENYQSSWPPETNCIDEDSKNCKKEKSLKKSKEPSSTRPNTGSEENCDKNDEKQKEYYVNSPSSSNCSDDVPLSSLMLRKSKASKKKIRKSNSKNSINVKSDKIETVNVENKIALEINKELTNNVQYNKSDDNQLSNCNLGSGFEEPESDSDTNDIDKLKDESPKKEKKRHFCKICNTEFPARFALSDHKKTHLFENTGCYKCDTCGKLCPKYDNFTRHLTIHLSNREKTHHCNDCSASFYNLADLKRHLVLHSTVKPFKCQDCGEGFLKEDNLLIHAYKHTGVQYKKFACKDCDKVLNSPSALVMHAKTHSAKTVFCPEPDCKFSCYLQSQLRQHLRKHSGEKPFQCAKCGRCFARSNDMKNHILNIHDKIKPFKCSLCPKEFSIIGNLKVHKNVHTNQKPYLCAQCGKSFNQPSTLKKHTMLVHSESDGDSRKISRKSTRAKYKNDESTNNNVTESGGVNDKNYFENPKEKILNEENNKPESSTVYNAENIINIANTCPPSIQQITREIGLQIPHLTVSLPIQIEHSQPFLVPTVILEPRIILSEN